jgi:lipoprotein-anchoring transpeptidase ErfK/SrfK
VKLIRIDRSAYTLELHVGVAGASKLIAAYPIAIGLPRYKTPRGVYFVSYKVKDPDWQVPDSPWTKRAGLIPGTIVPGGDPANPLIARWIDVDSPLGIGIHGTDSLESLGSRASHGCIRMHPEDVIELYDEIPHPPSATRPDGKLTPVVID